MRKRILLLICLSLSVIITSWAQDRVLWSDNFDDVDPMASLNVGWLYLSEAQGIKDVAVMQQNGELFMRQGNYEIIPGTGFGLGVAIIETNGTPFIQWNMQDTSLTDSSRTLLLKNDYSHPNQVLSFKVRFDRWRDEGEASSIFIVTTRLGLTDPNAKIPLSDATKEPGYAVAIWPLSGDVTLGKYDSTQFTVIFPQQWINFGTAKYSFKLNQDYRVKFYLREGDIKVKIWQGAANAEPTAWLIEGKDATPVVSGNFTAFGIAGNFPPPQGGDQLYLDDLKVEGWGGAAVDHSPAGQPADGFQLAQNYPNPFNSSTRIEFTLTGKNWTQLTILNLKGQVIRTLLGAELAAGPYSITWDGCDQSGRAVVSGLYFYQLTSGSQAVTNRLLLIK